MARPKKGVLSAAATRFAMVYAGTGDAVHAARVAGYRSPETNAYATVVRPEVQAEIARRENAKLYGTLLPVAIDTLLNVMKSTTAKDSSRVMAAKIVIDRTLGSGETPGGKAPEEMTAQELAGAIEAFKRAASERAKPFIEATANPVEGGIFG